MAEKEIIVKLSVEGGEQAANQIDKAAGATKNLAAGTTDANKALSTTAKELNATSSAADSLNKNTGSLKTQLRQVKDELQKLAIAGKANTEEYKRLREEAGRLQDAIADVNDEIRQAGSDTRGLDQTIRVATTAASAFGAVQAATALFGKENEELQRTLVKVTAAISLVQSLQQVQAEILKEDSVFTLAAAKAKGLYAAAVGTSSGALKIFRLALISTGIGAAVVAIGLLVANFDKLKSALLNAIPGLETFANFIGKVVNTVTDFVGITSEQGRAVEKANKRLKENNEVLERNLKIYRARKDAAKIFEAEEKILKNNIQALDNLAKVGDLTDEQLKQRKDLVADLNALRITYNSSLKEGTKQEEKNKDATKKTNEQIVAQVGSIKELNEQVARLRSLQEATNDPVRIAEYRKQIDELNRQIAELEKSVASLLRFQQGGNEAVVQLKALTTAVKQFKTEAEIAAEAAKAAFDSLPPTIREAIKELQGAKLPPIKTAQEIQKEIDDERNRRIQGAEFIAGETLQLFAQGLQARQEILDNRLRQGLITEEQYTKEVAKIRRKEAAAAKLNAVFNASLAVFEAFAKALAQFGNPIIAGIVKGLALANLAAIIATPLPKFRKGGEVLEGMIRGRSHEAGGVHIEAEGGEYIVNKAVTMKYRPIVEALNAGDLSKVVMLSLPRLPKTPSGSTGKMKDKTLQMILEEIQYTNAYIQQGNKYGREVAINSGKALRTGKRRHNV